MAQQLDLFALTNGEYRIEKPIRLIELFSGIGSQHKALTNLGLKFENWKTCEWAYNSIIGYNAIHIKDFTDYAKDMSKEQLLNYLNGNISIDYNKPADLTKKPIEWLKKCYNSCIANHNLMNIMTTKGKDLEITDTDKYEYIMTYSFPCQDLSLAGKKLGMSVSQTDGGTRSGLLWEVKRLLDELNRERERDVSTLPQILLMENVPEVVGERNIKDFQKWENYLSQLGYHNHIQILNGKDYGIPQNRRRCFMISILGGDYQFPRKFELKYKLKDFLETNVAERYYLSDKMVEYIKDGDFIDGFNRKVKSDVAGTIKTTISSSNETFVAIKNNNSKGYEIAKNGDGVDISGRMKYHRGTVQKGLAQTINTKGTDGGVVVNDKNKR